MFACFCYTSYLMQLHACIVYGQWQWKRAGSKVVGDIAVCLRSARNARSRAARGLLSGRCAVQRMSPRSAFRHCCSASSHRQSCASLSGSVSRTQDATHVSRAIYGNADTTRARLEAVLYGVARVLCLLGETYELSV